MAVFKRVAPYADDEKNRQNANYNRVVPEKDSILFLTHKKIPIAGYSNNRVGKYTDFHHTRHSRADGEVGLGAW